MLADAFLSSSQSAAQTQLAGAIQQASTSTGTSFEYLLAAAKIESNLDPGAQASTSSARGLFQFIEQTWLGTVKEAGSALGYDKYAAAIERLPSGRYAVSDPALRADILKLRDDPAASAAMAGILTQSNAAKLSSALGRRPTDGELYIAHFLGSGGAAKLIRNAESDPQASAAGLFPAAAGANRSIFYDRRSGRTRSVAEVYEVLTGKYTKAARTPAVQQALASVGTAPASALAAIHAATVPLPSPSPVSASPLAGTQALAYAVDPNESAKGDRLSRAQIGRPMNILPPAMRATVANGEVFHSLFHAGDRAQAVSPAVERIWGKDPNAAAGANRGPALSFARPSDPLDLFSDRTGKFAAG